MLRPCSTSCCRGATAGRIRQPLVRSRRWDHGHADHRPGEAAGGARPHEDRRKRPLRRARLHRHAQPLGPPAAREPRPRGQGASGRHARRAGAGRLELRTGHGRRPQAAARAAGGMELRSRRLRLELAGRIRVSATLRRGGGERGLPGAARHPTPLCRGPRPAASSDSCGARGHASVASTGVEDGGLGLSSGLTYVPGMYADDKELVALCRIVHEVGGFYCPHHRNYGIQALEAYADCIDLVRHRPERRAPGGEQALGGSGPLGRRGRRRQAADRLLLRPAGRGAAGRELPRAHRERGERARHYAPPGAHRGQRRHPGRRPAPDGAGGRSPATWPSTSANPACSRGRRRCAR